MAEINSNPPPGYSTSLQAAPLKIPARDLWGAVRDLPKAGTVYRGAA